jgi:2-oxoglutarate dehydrogenase E2 component (dihydrolipoamide succinyltransferase)
MGDSITQGTIESYEKNIGDWVDLDEVVAMVETDKITVDIRSPE